MKKIIFSIILFSTIFLTQCKEIAPPVIIDPSQLALFDTTYISTTEIPMSPKNILMEEFSGVKCSNCPKGNAKTKEFHAANTERINVLTVHSDFLASPYEGSQDLRCEDANVLAAAPLGPVSGKPSTYINRIIFSSVGTRSIGDINTWANLVDDELAKNSAINMNLETVFVNVNERKFRYRITLKFAEALQDISLGFALSESEIEAEQLDGSNHIHDYIHEWVLRDFITSVLGDKLTENIVANTVIIKEFEIDLDDVDYNPNGEWKISNMELVAFIRAENDEILQSVQIEL